MNFSSLKLSHKLSLSLGIIIVLFILVGSIANINMRKLGFLQDEGVSRFEDSQTIGEILGRMEGFYAIVGDAAINMDFESTKKDLVEFKEQAHKDIQEVIKIAADSNQKEAATKFEAAYLKYISIFENEMFPALERERAITEQIRSIDGKIDSIRDETRLSLVTIANIINEDSKNGDKEFDKIYQSSAFLALIFSLVGVAVAMLVAILLTKSLTTSLRSVSGTLRTGSSEVSQASGQMSLAAQSLSSSSTEAAASLEETVASLEQLYGMVNQNSNSSKNAATLSLESARLAETGDKEISSLVSAMNEISESSKKMSDIITVIDDIAFQTNLLALNASVEAARAGEQGKGFAVVAEAVRALAQRSAGSAKEIDNIIKDTIVKVSTGANIALESRDTLKKIVASIKQTNELSSQIAEGSLEQSHSLEQINKAMTHLDQATQKNAASAEETAATSEQLSHQSQVLLQAVHSLSEIIDGKQE